MKVPRHPSQTAAIAATGPYSACALQLHFGIECADDGQRRPARTPVQICDVGRRRDRPRRAGAHGVDPHLVSCCRGGRRHDRDPRPGRVPTSDMDITYALGAVQLAVLHVEDAQTYVADPSPPRRNSTRSPSGLHLGDRSSTPSVSRRGGPEKSLIHSDRRLTSRAMSRTCSTRTWASPLGDNCGSSGRGVRWRRASQRFGGERRPRLRRPFSLSVLAGGLAPRTFTLLAGSLALDSQPAQPEPSWTAEPSDSRRFPGPRTSWPDKPRS